MGTTKLYGLAIQVFNIFHKCYWVTYDPLKKKQIEKAKYFSSQNP